MPDHSLTYLLMLVFCVIQPLMVPVSVLYFVVNGACLRYDLIYVYREAFQSGGRFWPVVRCLSCGSLMMLQTACTCCGACFSGVCICLRWAGVLRRVVALSLRCSAIR